MKDEDKTKEQLINELEELRQRTSEAESLETESKRVEEALRKARDELERQIEERTADLVITNEQLQREIEERNRVEEAVRCREAILGAVGSAAERFLRTTCLENGGLQEVLAGLGQATKVSRVYVFENHLGEDGTHLTSLRYEWVAPGIMPQTGNPDLQSFSWGSAGMGRWEKTLRQGKIIQGYVREFPASEQRILVSQGIQSIMVVPIFVEKKWWGFAGFDECRMEREWIAAETGALKTASAILGALIERTRAEEALRENEEKFRRIFSNSPIGIRIYDSDGQLIDANKASLRIFGVSDAARIKCLKLFDEPFVSDDIKNRLSKRLPVTYEFALNFAKVKQLKLYETTKTGGVNLHVLITPLLYKKGPTFWGYLVQLQDISDRKRAEEHIHTLTQQLMKAHETERQRISRDLHDKVAQDLSTLKIACETLLDDQATVPSEIKQRLSELSKTLEKTIIAVRDLAYDLRPPGLDDMGLVQAVFLYCEDFSKKSGISVDFSSVGIDKLRLDFDTEINLYRLIQEGLNNIKKHADASHVTIRLVAAFPNIVVSIEDDGKGFDVKERLVTAMTEKRMGLRSMEERVILLGGKITIQSRPMQGTRIFIKVPYKAK